MAPPAAEEGLLLLDGLDGAVAGAGTALGADVLVDLVMISAFGNRVAGAHARAGAAGNAAVGNDVRWYVPPLFGIPAL